MDRSEEASNVELNRGEIYVSIIYIPIYINLTLLLYFAYLYQFNAMESLHSGAIGTRYIKQRKCITLHLDSQRVRAMLLEYLTSDLRF